MIMYNYELQIIIHGISKILYIRYNKKFLKVMLSS